MLQKLFLIVYHFWKVQPERFLSSSAKVSSEDTQLKFKSQSSDYVYLLSGKMGMSQGIYAVFVSHHYFCCSLKVSLKTERLIHISITSSWMFQVVV